MGFRPARPATHAQKEESGRERYQVVMLEHKLTSETLVTAVVPASRGKTELPPSHTHVHTLLLHTHTNTPSSS